MNHKESGLKIAVLGLGHVGLPTALGLADLGWSVVGADDDPAKAEMIARGEVPFYEPGVRDLLRQHLDSGNFVVAPEVAVALREGTVLFLCVGTPQREDGAADLSQIEGVARAIASNLNGYKLIVEKSTTPVQTAQQIKRSIQRYSASRHGNTAEPDDFDVAVNPEFLRESTALHDFFNPDRIVLGVDGDRAAKLLIEIYRPLLDRMGSSVEASVIVTDINTAEIIKHASNAFLATRISFINMIADLAEVTGANVQDVARGVGLDPRIGSRYLTPGIGFGGYCLPKDIQAFNWIASEHGVDFSLLREVQRVNDGRAQHFLSKVRKALWVVSGKTVAVWGLAFKPGTDDVRDAPSLTIVRQLVEEGARLRLFDPEALGEFRSMFGSDEANVTYCCSAEDAAERAEALLLLTEWPQFLDVDLARVRDRMEYPLIVDGRNLFDPGAVRGLGFEYYSIGRI